MRRGDVWWVAFGPHAGIDSGKPSLAVIVSHTGGNPNSELVQVVPIRSGQAILSPCAAAVTVNREAFTVMADRIATVSQGRLMTFVDHLSADDVRRVQAALRKQFGL